MSINDWQTIQTRNYVKKIKESLSTPQATEIAIIVDVVLILFSFLLGKIFEDTKISNVTWLIIMAAGLIIPGGLILKAYSKKRKADKYSNQILPYDEIIALFDDEICYKLMSALSFSKQLETLSSGAGIINVEPSLAIFYDLEATYYLNKAISILGTIKASLSDIISFDESFSTSDGILSYDRLQNACELIKSIRSQLTTSINSLSKRMPVGAYCRLVELNSRALMSSQEHFSEFQSHLSNLKAAHDVTKLASN